MSYFVLTIAGRFLVLMLWYGLILAILYKLTALDGVHHTAFRRARYARDIFALIIFALVVVEGFQIHKTPPEEWSAIYSTVLGGSYPFGQLHFFIGVSLLIVSITTFVRIIYPHVEKLHQASRCDEGKLSPSRFMELDESLSFLRSFDIKPLSIWCNYIVQHAVFTAPPDGGQSAISKATSYLHANLTADAFKWVMRWNDKSTEALILAQECQDWRESIRMITFKNDPWLRAETAQLICHINQHQSFGDQAIGLLNEDKDGRRRASIFYRQGKVGRARQILAHDDETRSWIHG